MSHAELSRPGPPAASESEVDRALAALQAAKAPFAALPLRERVRLVRECEHSTYQVVDEWHRAACEAKSIEPGSAAASEDLATGPMATIRYLQLLAATLDDIDREGRIHLPGPVRQDATGRLVVPVFPTPHLYDRLLFRGVTADVWMQPGLGANELGHQLASARERLRQPPGVSLVLGAGNVASIPLTDTLHRLFLAGQVVLLKMNPVNAYLGSTFERVLAPLVSRGFVRIVHGDAAVGAYCCEHPLVDSIHITGSLAAHEAIVWGSADERAERKRNRTPRLTKAITSELGNVTPWLIVPGEYTPSQLRFQAENVAAMIVNNASFNCIAVKMIVTWRGWPQRETFLSLLREALARIPPRAAYYPGALERYRSFSGSDVASAAENGAPRLPWQLLTDLDPATHPRHFREESFVCVCGETALDAPSAEAFLDELPHFANATLWGTLGAGVMAPDRLRLGEPERFAEWLARLNYGTLAVNHWPALSYALMSTPWGGYPGATLDDPQSGIGWVHNLYLLEGIEKTVLQGPLTLWPKPFWFASHRRAAQLARRAIDLYHRPNLWNLLRSLVPAMLG